MVRRRWGCGVGGGEVKPGNKTSFRSEMSLKTVAQEALEVRPGWWSLKRETEKERAMGMMSAVGWVCVWVGGCRRGEETGGGCTRDWHVFQIR